VHAFTVSNLSDMTMKRWLRRLGLATLLFATALGLGRLGQVWWDSQYFGARAPYLQLPAPTAMTVRWQTVEATVGHVRYGTAPDRLDRELRETAPRREHALRLTELSPGTRYWYQVGGVPGGDAAGLWFETPPAAGSPLSTRIWVLGDPGYGGERQRRVRDAAFAWADAHPRAGRPRFDVWLTTGDNAYTSGRNSEYQASLFDTYPTLLGQLPLWPAFGNHDARRYAYWSIFDFPQQGESGGVPSGSSRYFAFDHGPIHFVMLDSHGESTDPDGAMARWLQRDLAANRLPWTVAITHYPAYSKGTHDSDSWRDGWGRQIAVREELLPLLDAAGVDLVLTGHSHSYERSYPIVCHYGRSPDLAPWMLLGPGPELRKAGAGAAPFSGAIHAVVGSSAKVDKAPLDHPANAFSLAALGSLVVEVAGDRLSGVFVDDAGAERDRFAIVKGSTDAPAPRLGCRAPF
jgi:hypothetical protein